MAKFLGFEKDVPFKGDIAPSSTLQSDDFERLVFAPDPGSGNPCSSLAYLAKGEDEISRFVREHYLKDTGTGTSGFVSSVDVDSALELAPNFGESRDAYLQRVSNMINDYYKVDES